MPHVEGNQLYELLQYGSSRKRNASIRLHAFKLPNSQHVDRSLCAEFQLLNQLCHVLLPDSSKLEPQPSYVGIVALFTTTSPCMSCIGVIRQFQLIFPEIRLETSERNDIDTDSKA